MGYKISIDPGRNTGFCVWKDGKPVGPKIITLRPQGKDLGEMVASLIDLLDEEFLAVATEDTIECVAVEDFPVYHSVDKDPARLWGTKKAMKVCATFQGAIMATARLYAMDVILISKGKIKKIETALLAKSWGLKGSKDALDAFQIGICAGFDKK
jgi:hypothetical protein